MATRVILTIIDYNPKLQPSTKKQYKKAIQGYMDTGNHLINYKLAVAVGEWHAVERLWEVAHQLLAEDDQTPAVWMKQQKTALWNSRLRDVFGAIRLLCPGGKPLPEPVRQVAGYLFNNRCRVWYKEYRQVGQPIGSGSVESACKVAHETSGYALEP